MSYSGPLRGSTRELTLPELISLLKLTTIDYKRGQDLPEEIQALDGKLVKIEGYMALGTEEGQEESIDTLKSFVFSIAVSKLTHWF